MLRVIVEHMVYPVTLDVIHQIFSRVGKVMKIVTFTKNNNFQVNITFLFLFKKKRNTRYKLNKNNNCDFGYPENR